MSQIFTTEAQVQAIINSIISGQRNSNGGLAGIGANGQIDPKYLASALAIGNGGAIITSDTPPADSVERVYFPSQDGTYTNFDGIVVTLADGLNLVIGSDTGGFTKVVVPIDLSNYPTLTYLNELSYIETNVTGNLTNSLLNADGTTSSNNNWRTTDFIEFDANNGFIFNATSYPGLPYASVIVYDSFDAIQEVIYKGDSRLNDFIFYSYDYKIRCCARQTGGDLIEVLKHQLVKDRVLALQETVDNNSSVVAKVEANPYFGKTKTNYPFPNAGYINSSGAFISNINLVTTDFLEIGDFFATYRFSIAVLNASAINFYNEFQVWMSAKSQPYKVDGTFVDRFIEIPAGAKFVRVTSQVAYTQREVYTNIDNLKIEFKSLGNPNRLYKKDAVNFGDSITWYDGKVLAANSNGGTGGGEMCIGYIQILARTLGFSSYDNEGASGKSISGNDANSNHAAITAYDFSNKDIATIAHGTNDFKLNRSIGTIGSITDTVFDTNTFYGAYRTVLNAIKNSNVNCEVFLITPIQRNNAGYTTEFTNTAGHKLIDYVNAIKFLGEMYSFKVIDLYGESGINFSNLFSFTIDGLHPNNAGHLRMGNSVLREIV